MCQVNIHQAKTDLSKLIAMLERGDEDEVIIARDGKPVAKMVFYADNHYTKRRFGIASGSIPKWTDETQKIFDDMDKEIQEAFGL
ncbi:MAG: hypothetical protein MJ169_06175 [Treponema sp.]|nr:hypothetical protein [Treponema sp.]